MFYQLFTAIAITFCIEAAFLFAAIKMGWNPPTRANLPSWVFVGMYASVWAMVFALVFWMLP